MHTLENNYFIIAGYITAGVMLGIYSNYIKSKWSWIAFILLVYVGILINCWPFITWDYGILEEIWRIAWEGTVWYLIPTLLVMGFLFFVGRFGYQFIEKALKK
jgi:hypothetical protein